MKFEKNQIYIFKSAREPHIGYKVVYVHPSFDGNYHTVKDIRVKLSNNVIQVHKANLFPYNKFFCRMFKVEEE